MEEGGKGGPGDPPTVGHILVQQPRGADEKRARCWDDHWLEVRGNDVEVQGRPAGQHSRTKPRGLDEKGARAGTIVEPSKANHGEINFGSVRGGPVRRQRKDREMTKEDRRTGRQTGKKRWGGWGKRKLGAGDVPSRRISPCTLLLYEGSFPSRWPQRREEEGEGGVRL